ncbi:MAG: hypothetical protein JNK05_08105 [Myxococcales bacterium]|nr:hypothetical protein [Myxococcales bacterium]
MIGVPPGVTLNALSSAVFHALEEYTVFPWSVLSTQCKRIGIDPSNLTVIELERVSPLLAQGVARFTTPAHEVAVKAKLAALIASNRGRL